MRLMNMIKEKIPSNKPIIMGNKINLCQCENCQCNKGNKQKNLEKEKP